MKKLVIGIDADGVLVDMSGFYVREGEKYFHKKPVNVAAYSPSEMFCVSKIKEILFGLCVFTKYCKFEPPYPDCVKMIQQLLSEGYELHEITARKMTTSRTVLGTYYRYLFEKWLKKNGIEFGSIQYCSEKYVLRDKLLGCSKLNIDIMIEDKPDVALYLAENNIRVFLYDAPYNKQISHKNITRVHNWKEVYVQIVQYETKYIPPYKRISKEERILMNKEEMGSYIRSCRSYYHSRRLDSEEISNSRKKFRLVYVLTWLPFVIMYRVKSYGKENIPFQNGFIIASNHLDSRDQYYISRVLGNRQFCGFAASTIQDTFRGKVSNYTEGAIFIDRTNDESKLVGEEKLIEKIVSGTTALIFPEGTRKNKDAIGKKQIQLPFKMGAVSIAQKAGTAILPVSIFHGKRKTIVRIGELQYVLPTDDLVMANKRLEETILALTEESRK